MAQNDFKPFATGDNANVTTQADWEVLPALTEGFTSGKAFSAQVNKGLRQSTFIASAMAQFVSDALEADVLDDGDVAAFVTNFISALKSKDDGLYVPLTRTINDKSLDADITLGAADVNATDLIASNVTDAATFRTNLGLGNAAPLNVGTTAGTVAAGDDARFGASITLEDIYLVGSEFSSYTDSRNPADILGFGTWTPVVGLIAGVGAATDSQGLTANYTAGYQAGSWRVQNGHIVAQNLDVALTMNPVDDHEHPLTVYWLNTSAQTAVIGAGASATVNGTTNSGGAGGHTPTGSGAVTIGSGTATDSAAFFSPYYGKYIWVRTA